MAGPSLSMLIELQEQLDKFSRLATEELGKGTDCSETRVAQYKKRVENLIAQIKLMPSGELQTRTVLCCQASLASGQRKWSVKAKTRSCWGGVIMFRGTMASMCWAVPGHATVLCQGCRVGGHGMWQQAACLLQCAFRVLAGWAHECPLASA